MLVLTFTPNNKMIKKSFLTIVSFFIFMGVVSSQEKTTKRYPSIAIGGGILTFSGDIGTKAYSKRRVGYNAALEQRFGKHFGVSLGAVFGKLADSEIGKVRNFNFESKVTQADLNIIFHFGNDSTKFAPFLSVGAGYLMFDTYSDLTDENGIKYNYWQDGTIRSLPENATNAATATRLKRDYTYETQLTKAYTYEGTKLVDSTTVYKRNAIALPIALGLNIRVFEKLHVKLAGTYYMTMTDYIDNVKDGGNDSYIYANVAVQYTLGKKADVNADDKVRSEKGFQDIDKLDSDGDGIVDTDDICPGTPAGVQITPTGCPVDTDEDGVPDYKDEEPKTLKGAFVNDKGITQTPEMIAARQQQFEEMASKRLHSFVENPSDAKKVDEKQKNGTGTGVAIPEELKSADKNNDGFISTEEIGKSIDSFFDGDSDFTVEKLNDLIDVFFEQ